MNKATSTLLLSEDAYRAILGMSDAGFRAGTSEHTKDGWLIEVTPETIDRLFEMKLPGEDYNDVLIRAVAFYNSRGNQ